MQWPLGGFLSFHCLAPRVSAHNPHRVHPSSKAQAVFFNLRANHLLQQAQGSLQQLDKRGAIQLWVASPGSHWRRCGKDSEGRPVPGVLRPKDVKSCDVMLCVFGLRFPPGCLAHSRFHNTDWRLRVMGSSDCLPTYSPKGAAGGSWHHPPVLKLVKNWVRPKAEMTGVQRG